ncbi:SOS-induced cell division inhibitor SulA [Providencia sneebia]|uniref:Cell division inhibitor SulA n=1 Tax=Providencia sneebia DSM 19967 TaxID=1141660 RepID=K8WLW9_9GAMM|nr:SOS-induced cell division inhibitor SulA [Providencia sneebia]EKT58462.1 SOS cell division inhibitor [Providencia sneebia DSM 19967]
MANYYWNKTNQYPQSYQAQATPTVRKLNDTTQQGMVSELVYDEKHSIINYILLPILRQLGVQARWLLWLSPNQKLSRNWLEQSGLPINKIIQLNRMDDIETVSAMEKALRSGNYSVVLGWLPNISEQDFIRLQIAALEGHTIGFIMRPQKSHNSASNHNGQQSNLKIHSNYYH